MAVVIEDTQQQSDADIDYRKDFYISAAGTDRVVFVLVTRTQAVNQITGVTVGGVVAALVHSAVGTQYGGAAYIYQITESQLGVIGSKEVRVSIDGSYQKFWASAIALSNVYQTTPIANVDDIIESNTSPDVRLVTVATGGICIDIAACDTGSIMDYSGATGQTEIFTVNGDDQTNIPSTGSSYGGVLTQMSVENSAPNSRLTHVAFAVSTTGNPNIIFSVTDDLLWHDGTPITGNIEWTVYDTQVMSTLANPISGTTAVSDNTLVIDLGGSGTTGPKTVVLESSDLRASETIQLGLYYMEAV